MVVNPDPIKSLIDSHIGLLDDLYLLRTRIDRLLKKISPNLVEGLNRLTYFIPLVHIKNNGTNDNKDYINGNEYLQRRSQIAYPHSIKYSTA